MPGYVNCAAYFVCFLIRGDVNCAAYFVCCSMRGDINCSVYFVCSMTGYVNCLSILFVRCLVM